ncbi:DNA polymerase I [Novipirellula aureliae]|uniref:DNA polymerase I n=1 Tax=Novipirellula aureliae TaxID=2527966 RepID=A0A5C6D8F2_9BACT|nr:DNA polymerase [Novipirellula aureliae]TWU33433.1 DNA polymerase I [Novipirellula aureliae]
MNIEFKNKSFAFRPWRSEDGCVLRSPFAFDSETTLLDETRPQHVPTFVVGAAFDGNAGYFVHHSQLESFWNHHSTQDVIFHHACFDLGVIKKACARFDPYAAVDEDRVWDTRILFRLWQLATLGETARGRSSLIKCAAALLGLEMDKEVEDSHGRRVRTSFGKYLGCLPNELPPEYLQYLATDTIATFQLHDALLTQISASLRAAGDAFGYRENIVANTASRFGPLSHHIQLRGSIVLDAVRRNGMAIDQARVESLLEQLSVRQNELRLQLLSRGYSPGQPGCNKSLQRIFRDIDTTSTNLTLPRKASGQYSTRSDDLSGLAHEDGFLSALFEFRENETLMSTFLAKLNAGRVHPSFDVLVRSGRTSSFGALSAQNLPCDDAVRGCIIPSEGYVFIDADYAAIELATLAQVCLSQFGVCSGMAEAINAGIDLHRHVAANMLTKAPELVTKEERQAAKAVNFGRPGGLSDRGLQRYAKAAFGVELSDAQVATLTAAWFTAFPEMRVYLDDNKNVGVAISRFLDLTPLSFAAETGEDWVLRTHQHEIVGMLGWMARKVFAAVEPTNSNGRLYPQSWIDYFWRTLDQKSDSFTDAFAADIRARNPSRELAAVVCNLACRSSCVTLTGRLRANTIYCQSRNTLFQGLAADGAKLALWTLWRAGYRIVNFIHDELLIEVSEDSDLLANAEAIRSHMVAGMRQVVPDVRIDVQYTCMRRWLKTAELVIQDGRLIPWEDSVPSEDPLAHV